MSANASNGTATPSPSTSATVPLSTTLSTAPPTHPMTSTQSAPGPETLLPVILVIAAVVIALIVACILFRRRQVRRKKNFTRQLEITNRRIRAIGMLKARAEHELASWPHQQTSQSHNQFQIAGEVQSTVVPLGNASVLPNDSFLSSVPRQPPHVGFPVEVHIQRRHSSNTVNIPQVTSSLGNISAHRNHLRRHSSEYFQPAVKQAVCGFPPRFSRLRIADSDCPPRPGNVTDIVTDTEIKSASHAATQGSSFAQVESSNLESFYPSSACGSPCWANIDPSKVGAVVREQWTGTPLASEVSTVTDSQTCVSSHTTHQSEKWV